MLILDVKWTRPAISDLIEAQSYIEQENPQAAKMIAKRIWNGAQSLNEQPRVGRMGKVEGTREWVIQRTPYLIVYRINATQIEILHLYHGKQNWQNR